MTAAAVPAGRVRENLRHARENLLGGRGPGASEEEVAAHTRNRVGIAGVAATRRLELAARDTTRARRDTAGLSDTIEIASGALARTVAQLGARLQPRHLAAMTMRGVVARVRANPARFALAGAALVLVARGRRRGRRGQVMAASSALPR
jgi:hypothetical protein